MATRLVFFATNRLFDPKGPGFGTVPDDPPGRVLAGWVDTSGEADPALEGKAGTPHVEAFDDPDSGLVTVLKQWLAKAEGGIALLSVHGFNYSFSAAMARTGALCAWLEEGGAPPLVPLCFTWPSNGVGSIGAYKDDQVDAASSGLALARLVAAVAALKPTVPVVYLAHSMGARATRCAMQEMAQRFSPLPKGVFRQAVIMAGDDAADVFDAGEGWASDSAGGMRPLASLARYVTIGVNRADGVVSLVSGQVNRGDRLGTAGPGRPKDLPGNVKVVDYSEVVAGADLKPVPTHEVEPNWIGHQYLRNDKRVRQDLVALMAQDTAPEQVKDRRWGEPQPAVAFGEFADRLYPV
ncbi:alpha/beta hydrolase family protein DUF900 [Humitalea rosea]|uniref:Alpha/beta hydrolase family protein DUF900 n=1 Tax=Humitalea rosea TaxID=990373 RepID=A0A2W7IKW4_9PROT|nr:alpha/beta hydrolase [Humitalea rosea]PZW40017.1 alpha/beta hydrolase family protein DUF900 [Humitalea rosea]